MKRIVLGLLAWSLCAASLQAAGEGGTESPFAFGAGARDLALAGAAIADGDPTAAPFWNASRMVTSERFALSGFHCRLFESGVAYQYLGLVVPTLDAGSFGLGVFRLGVDGIEAIDGLGIRQGEIQDSRLGFYLAYARSLSGFNVGTALSLEHHSLGDYSTTSSPGLDLSASRRFEPGGAWLRHATFALQLRNVIRPASKLVDATVDYPTAVEGAVSVECAPPDQPHSLTLSAALAKVDDIDFKAAFGAEYRFRNLLALRGGVRAGDPSFGAGLGYGPIAFDYALVDRDFGSLHMFTLTVSFGTSTSVRRQQRADRQEAEFNRLMSDRLAAGNRAMSEQLVARGESLLARGDLKDALDHFDRALFLARSSGADTTRAAERWSETRQMMAREDSAERYRLALDSARVRKGQADYVAARYFANLALKEEPGSTEAKEIQNEASRALAATAEREKMIRSRLLAVDSLLSYGQIGVAQQTAEALRQIAGDDPAVKAAVRRTRFEHWRAEAADAYAAQSYGSALEALDSALALYPGHEVCLDMQRDAKRALATAQAPKSVSAAAPKALSGQLEAQARELYESGCRAFEKGLLDEAIDRWEKVELLAPGYQAVRSYLVNAYKFVGVENYGQNRLQEAITAWRKAYALDPDNAEIAGYIRRTENEIVKLREFSYDR